MTMPVKFFRYMPVLVGFLLVVVVIYFSVKLLSITDDGNASRKKVVQQVTILRPPPPPPKLEQPPEPEVQKEVEIAEPLEDIPDIPDAPPMGDLLGLDADGSGGSDGFGLIGRKGGRSILDGEPNVIYASKLLKEIENLLAENETMRSKAYSVGARLWVNQDGSILRAKLSGSTGDEKIDSELLEMLSSISLSGQSPPDGMPQPVKLRISSRL